MKALTIWQPYASLVIRGKKRIETRSWKTPYRGRILIHAAKRPYSRTERLIAPESRKRIREVLGLGFMDWKERVPEGVILGSAVLADCRLIDRGFLEDIREDRPDELLFGDFTPGRYAWMLEDIRIFGEPVPASGRQRLWDFAGSVPETAGRQEGGTDG